MSRNQYGRQAATWRPFKGSEERIEILTAATRRAAGVALETGAVTDHRERSAFAAHVPLVTSQACVSDFMMEPVPAFRGVNGCG